MSPQSPPATKDLDLLPKKYRQKNLLLITPHSPSQIQHLHYSAQLQN
jgi:hypothetical protein